MILLPLLLMLVVSGVEQPPVVVRVPRSCRIESGVEHKHSWFHISLVNEQGKAIVLTQVGGKLDDAWGTCKEWLRNKPVKVKGSKKATY